jgi:hypothetical protein
MEVVVVVVAVASPGCVHDCSGLSCMRSGRPLGCCCGLLYDCAGAGTCALGAGCAPRLALVGTCVDRALPRDHGRADAATKLLCGPPQPPPPLPLLPATAWALARTSADNSWRDDTKPARSGCITDGPGSAAAAACAPDTPQSRRPPPLLMSSAQAISKPSKMSTAACLLRPRLNPTEALTQPGHPSGAVHGHAPITALALRKHCSALAYTLCAMPPPGKTS